MKDYEMMMTIVLKSELDHCRRMVEIYDDAKIKFEGKVEELEYLLERVEEEEAENEQGHIDGSSN